MSTIEDALRKEEEIALQKPPLQGHYMAEAQEGFPHLKHTPYIDWVMMQGKVHRLQQGGPRHPMIAALDPGNALLQHYIGQSRHYRRQVDEAVTSLKRQHHFEMSESGLLSYHVRLAGRALAFAKQHFPGLAMDAPNLAEIAKETAKLPDNEMLRKVTEAIKDPLSLISEAIANIRLFYEHEMSR